MIRQAALQDIDRIMVIVAQAQRRLADAGVYQWQDGYPSPDVFKNDIENGNCYVAEIDGIVMGFSVMIFDIEPTYALIEGGEWLSSGQDYCVIHRMAVDDSQLRAGLGRAFFEYTEQLCRERGIGVIRIDTHKDNIPMQSLIANMNYTYCGIITLLSGALRNAYEKIL